VYKQGTGEMFALPFVALGVS